MENVIAFLKSLREEIIAEFESLEISSKRFERTAWEYQKGSGGGEIALIRGETFEKAAVNFSFVSGNEFPGADGKGPFSATGISLITHMSNPYAPTAHFNLRFIQTPEKSWLGGGYDLTPMGFPFEEDTLHFHQTTKEALDVLDDGYYPHFSNWAKEYFYIPHRHCERGVGGIFFDHLNTGDAEKDQQMWQCVGKTFTKALLPILQRRISMSYGEKEKEMQLLRRGRYVEFNLLYDRGTKFGFQSGGNPDAILCSLPPLVKW